MILFTGHKNMWITVSIIKLRKEKYVASTVRPNLWADKHIIHIGKSIWMCIAEENVSVVPFILISSNQSVYNYSSSCKVDFTQIHRQTGKKTADRWLLSAVDLWSLNLRYTGEICFYFTCLLCERTASAAERHETIINERSFNTLLFSDWCSHLCSKVQVCQRHKRDQSTLQTVISILLSSFSEHVTWHKVCESTDRNISKAAA